MVGVRKTMRRASFIVVLLGNCALSLTQSDAYITLRVRSLNNIRFASGYASLQAAIDDVTSSHVPGEVWVDAPLTITGTVTVGQNSPSNVPVTLRILRGAKVTVNIANSADVFQLAGDSRITCDGGLGIGTYASAPQIQLAGTAAVRDVFRALDQNGSQEAMFIEGCSVDGGASGGATVQSIFNYSELFEGSYLHDVMATNFQGPRGRGACGIKIYNLPGATDGAGGIDFRNFWILPTGNNHGLCVDGTGSANHMNRINFTQGVFSGNGTLSGPQVKIVSGFNGQLKSFNFTNITNELPTASNQTVWAIDGLYGSSFKNILLVTNSGSNNTGFALGNRASRKNFGNVFDNITFVNGFSTLIADARPPTVGGAPQTIAADRSGNTLDHYAQDDGNTTAPRWNRAGIVLPANSGPGNIVIDTAPQTLTHKIITNPNIAAGVAADASGFKHKRVHGCTTDASVGATCMTTVKWDTTFADRNYTAVCTGEPANSGVPVSGGLTAKAASSITFRTVAITAAAARFATIDCIAVHD